MKIEPTPAPKSETPVPEIDEKIDVNQPLTNASLDEIGSTLIDAMPEVQQHAIDLEATKTTDQIESDSLLIDSQGTKFDRNIHKTKRDDSPSLSKHGKFMLKPKAQRKQPDTNKSGEGIQSDSQQLSESDTQQSEMLGKVSASVLFSMGRMIGGEEWQPIATRDYNEVEAMEQAFAEYYKSTGQTEMSPQTALIFAIGSYALPRFTMPATQQKSKSLGKKIFGWWNNRKGRKEEQARAKAETIRQQSEKQVDNFKA